MTLEEVDARRSESSADADRHDLLYWLQIPDVDVGGAYRFLRINVLPGGSARSLEPEA
jgi:hypothetical protein